MTGEKNVGYVLSDLVRIATAEKDRDSETGTVTESGLTVRGRTNSWDGYEDHSSPSRGRG